MNTNQNLRTVGEVSALLGISVRTLHYWQEKDLVTPAARSWSEYRLYSDDDIARLQQIMIYRATGMSLDTIRDLLDSASSPVEHLQHQRSLLIEKRRELTDMLEALDLLLEETMTKNELSVDEVAQILDEPKFAQYAQEAEENWGQTDDWAIAQRNQAAMSGQDWRDLKERTQQVEERLAHAMREGVEPGSALANELAEEHRELLSVYFPVSHAKHAILARGYVADERFSSYYEKRASGLAQWLKNIIDANAAANGIAPEDAKWQ